MESIAPPTFEKIQSDPHCKKMVKVRHFALPSAIDRSLLDKNLDIILLGISGNLGGNS